MGLDHRDFATWQAAHRSRWRPRRTRTRHALLALGGPDPEVLVTLDNASRTTQASLVATLAHLPTERLAVLLDPACMRLLPSQEAWSVQPWQQGAALPNTALTLLGSELDLGGLALEGRSTRAVVLQHGILTPDTPPLPPQAHLLAWQDTDLQFWAEGRPDVTGEGVGAQLLWEAQGSPVAVAGPLTFLGQLHGSELPRRSLVAAAQAFCLETGARYRPHPSEIDRRSRWQHDRWRRAGMIIEATRKPLLEAGTPVASVYSTGVLEAAAAGLPAWVSHPSPPDWLCDLWQRYGMAAWETSVSTALPSALLPEAEPAANAARALLRLADSPHHGGRS